MGHSPTDALIWFVATTVGVFGVIALGTYLAMHAYDRRRHGH